PAAPAAICTLSLHDALPISPSADEDYAVIVEQTTLLSEDVLSGLLLWSIVTLLVFTGLAVAAASWLSRRSFARIGQITTTTQQIDRKSTRLNSSHVSISYAV